MKNTIAFLSAALLAACTTAQPSPERDKNIAALERKGWGLLNRAADLTTQVSDAAATNYANQKLNGYKK